MPFKNTNKNAYRKARKYPKFIRSRMYKIFKFSEERKLLLSVKHRRFNKSNILKRSQVSIRPNATHKKYILEVEGQTSCLVRDKIEILANDLVSYISDYLISKGLSISSSPFKILVSIGKISVSAVRLYNQKEKYILLFEVINGELSYYENEYELKNFMDLNQSLIKEIIHLSKEIGTLSV